MNRPVSGLPFDDIRALIASLPAPDEAAIAAVRARDRELTKPAGSLGRLEESVEWLAAWQAKAPPSVDQPLIAVFAANHGVVARGVSAFPPEVTRQMVENFSAGGAAINQLAREAGAGLKIFDLALDLPTPDICEAAALTEAECAATMAFGMESIAGGADLLCLGEMGIGNTTIAAALSCALFGGAPADWVGPGAGVGEEGIRRKVDAVEAAMAVHGSSLSDPLEALRRVGGRELAAIAGAILAARHQRIPVLLDGFVVTAAAAVLHRLNPSALDHCMAAHHSAEPAHQRLLEAIGKKPLLDLGMRLGEGSGAALAIGVVKAALAVHKGMATFSEAGVAQSS